MFIYYALKLNSKLSRLSNITEQVLFAVQIGMYCLATTDFALNVFLDVDKKKLPVRKLSKRLLGQRVPPLSNFTIGWNAFRSPEVHLLTYW